MYERFVPIKYRVIPSEYDATRFKWTASTTPSAVYRHYGLQPVYRARDWWRCVTLTSLGWISFPGWNYAIRYTQYSGNLTDFQ